ncbi:polysaccharide deacetylase family protein [Alicyclobacillus sp. ALC3]|nr:polysaccharide deacetylase family protein [Alicyclobacillus sp. ALC3]
MEFWNLNWKTGVIACAIFVWCIPGNIATATAVKRVPTDKKVVALTFDDGPSAKFTPIILETLRENHARATFFVIGSRVERLPEVLTEELREHDEIANHSFKHQIMTSLSEQRIYSELSSTQQAIQEATGSEQPLMFRPPRGRINKRILQVAEDHHYKVVMWSIDSGDWANPGVHQIVKTVLSQVKSGDIILFHDQGGSRRQTVTALKQIIPVLRRRGYEFVTVSDLIST